MVTNSLHPGVIQTKLLRAGFGMRAAGSLDEGAATSVYLALDPAGGAVSGRYFTACEERPPATTDEQLAADLWELSERLVGLR